MQRYGITIPFDAVPLVGQRDLVAELAGLGYTDVWSSESSGADAFTPLALASAWAPTLRLGTAIVPVYTRGPATLAQCTATLAAAAPGRVAIGIGASSDVIVERWNGGAFDRPLERVRDTARFLRAALTGAKVTERYETFAVDGFRLGLVPERPPRLLIAALRPGMLRLAGQESDGAILIWLAPGDVGAVTPYVHQAGPGREIAARIFVAATADAEEARGQARRAIAAYLTVPVYRAFHEWLGRGERLAPMWRAWASGDRRAALAAIPDEVVDELVVHGPPQRCREQVQRYVDAGVTTPILALLPVGGDVREIVRGLAPAAVGSPPEMSP
ncbi:MAG TPA: LLM class F420-dependent oxidoreductase [Actinomycetes bacterium]|jgi:probable F420-dependent oxidoreductase|nr:LLM class F420-dependent oxidoreductase [Actinomycetes bacterium]